MFTLLFCTAGFASDGDKNSSLGNVVVPQPNKPPNATECVAPTDVMRRQHMDLLNHQRDKTVIDGIRTKAHSLVECINCHVQADENGQVARIDEPEHFCAGCHMFAGVKIDCFECHADRPANTAYRHSLDTDNPHHLANLRIRSLDAGVNLKALGTFIEQVTPVDE